MVVGTSHKWVLYTKKENKTPARLSWLKTQKLWVSLLLLTLEHPPFDFVVR